MELTPTQILSKITLDSTVSINLNGGKNHSVQEEIPYRSLNIPLPNSTSAAAPAFNLSDEVSRVASDSSLTEAQKAERIQQLINTARTSSGDRAMSGLSWDSQFLSAVVAFLVRERGFTTTGATKKISVSDLQHKPYEVRGTNAVILKVVGQAYWGN